MTTSDTLYRIAEMGREHYQQSAEFERQQKEAIASVLEQIIAIVGFKLGPPYDEPLFESFYSVPRLLDHIKSVTQSVTEHVEESSDAS